MRDREQNAEMLRFMRHVNNKSHFMSHFRHLAYEAKETIKKKNLQVYRVQLNLDGCIGNVSIDFPLTELQDIVDSFFSQPLLRESDRGVDHVTDLVLLGSSKLSTIHLSIKSMLSSNANMLVHPGHCCCTNSRRCSTTGCRVR